MKKKVTIQSIIELARLILAALAGWLGGGGIS